MHKSSPWFFAAAILSVVVALVVWSCSKKGTESTPSTPDIPPPGSPYISAANLFGGFAGDTVNVLGRDFRNDQDSSFVEIDAVIAEVMRWSDSLVSVLVPEPDPSGGSLSVKIVIAGDVTKGKHVVVGKKPILESIEPDTVTFGDMLTLTGSEFGDTQENGDRVMLGDASLEVVSWSASEIVVRVTSADSSGDIRAYANNRFGDPKSLVVCGILGLSSHFVEVGDTVNVVGTGFGDSQDDGEVMFGEMPGNALSWSNEDIRVKVPAGVEGDSLYLDIGGFRTNSVGISVADTALTNLLGLLQLTKNVDIDFFGRQCWDSNLTSCYCDTLRMGNFYDGYRPATTRIRLNWDEDSCGGYYHYYRKGGSVTYELIYFNLSCKFDVQTPGITRLRLRSVHEAHSMGSMFSALYDGDVIAVNMPLELISMTDSLRVSFFVSGPQMETKVDSLFYYNWFRGQYGAQFTDYDNPDCPPWIRVTFTGPLPE